MNGFHAANECQRFRVGFHGTSQTQTDILILALHANTQLTAAYCDQISGLRRFGLQNDAFYKPKRSASRSETGRFAERNGRFHNTLVARRLYKESPATTLNIKRLTTTYGEPLPEKQACKLVNGACILLIFMDVPMRRPDRQSVADECTGYCQPFLRHMRHSRYANAHPSLKLWNARSQQNMI